MESHPYSANYWIRQLKLQPHPEGGWFAETYRSVGQIPDDALPETFNGSRSYSTAIYFLLEAGQFSAFHRISSDEGWHFYAGDPMTVYVIHPDGRREDIHLGPNPDQGQQFQAYVPSCTWFGSAVDEGGKYALVGCTVAPGFDFADFEMATSHSLLEQFPQHADLIHKLTH